MFQNFSSEQRVREFADAPDGDEVQSESNGLSTLNVMRGTISDAVGRAMGPGLKAKSLRAVMKLSMGTTVGYGMRFVRRMILARLLAPSDIGLMAIVISLSTAFEALTEVGIKIAVIQNKQGAKSEYLNVVWWLQMIRGFVLFFLVIILAPWISAFYHKPELLNLLRVSSFAIMLRGLISPRAYVLEKEYRFGRSVMLNQGSVALSSVLTVVLALLMRNVWALVIGFVAETGMLSIGSFIVVPILPRFRIDRQSFGELMKFARDMFGLPIITFVSNQAPILVLGKILSDDKLGFYSYAALLAYFPVLIFTRMVGPVLLPAFSEKQDDHVALRRGLLLVTRWTATFAIPVATYIACCSEMLLSIIYKPTYAVMAIPFAVLGMQIITWSETSILASLYFAVGRPELHRRYSIARAAAVIALIYPASIHFGGTGAAGVVVISGLLLLLMQMSGCSRIIGLDFRGYFSCYVPGLALALPIMVTFYLLRLLGMSNHALAMAIYTFVFIAVLAMGLLPMIRSKTIGAHDGDSL